MRDGSLELVERENTDSLPRTQIAGAKRVKEQPDKRRIRR